MSRPATYVYVSGPYSKGDMALHVRNAIQAGDELLQHGYVPYVPHLSHFQHMIFPHDYELWLEIDFAWVKKCDALIRLPGESSGADREVELARSLGIPVYFSIQEFLEREA